MTLSSDESDSVTCRRSFNPFSINPSSSVELLYPLLKCSFGLAPRWEQYPLQFWFQLFRTQYILFVLYLSFVQFLQYYYQRGCLYRLRALGERHNMDITAEGFQVPGKRKMLTRDESESRRKKLLLNTSLHFGSVVDVEGTVFYLAFPVRCLHLSTLQCLRTHAAVFSWRLWRVAGRSLIIYITKSAQHTWHMVCLWQFFLKVPLLSALFLVLFVGNVGTTLLVMRKKIIRGADYLWALRNKYKMEWCWCVFLSSNGSAAPKTILISAALSGLFCWG